MNHKIKEKALLVLEHPLAYPGLIVHETGRVLLRVWRYPSFAPWCSWAVLAGSEGLFLRRIVWDSTNSQSPDPVTYGCEVPLSKDAFDLLLHDLQSVHVPPFAPTAGIGVDGTRFGIEITDHMFSACFCWWPTVSVSWIDLQHWHDGAVDFFEMQLPTSTPTYLQGETRQ